MKHPFLIILVALLLSPIDRSVAAEELLGDCDGIVWGAPVDADVAGLGHRDLEAMLDASRRMARRDPARAQWWARRAAFGAAHLLERGKTFSAGDLKRIRLIQIRGVEAAAEIWEGLEDRRPYATAMWREAVRLRLLVGPESDRYGAGLRHARARTAALAQEFRSTEAAIEARRAQIDDPFLDEEARALARVALARLLGDRGHLDEAVDQTRLATRALLEAHGPCEASLRAMLLEAIMLARAGDPDANLAWLRAAVVHRELGDHADRAVRHAGIELGRLLP